MQYRVVQKDGFRLVGRKARVPLVHEGTNPAIIAFIRSIDRETVERIEQLSDQEPRGIVNATDNLADRSTEGTELDYFHGVVTSAATPADLDGIDVPAGTWAVFESSGAFPQAVQYLWRDVFTEWFPANPYRTRPGPEMVRTRLSADGTQADAQLWIPVQRSPA